MTGDPDHEATNRFPCWALQVIFESTKDNWISLASRCSAYFERPRKCREYGFNGAFGHCLYKQFLLGIAEYFLVLSEDSLRRDRIISGFRDLDLRGGGIYFTKSAYNLLNEQLRKETQVVSGENSFVFLPGKDSSIVSSSPVSREIDLELVRAKLTELYDNWDKIAEGNRDILRDCRRPDKKVVEGFLAGCDFISKRIGIEFKNVDDFSAFLSGINDIVTKPTKEYEYARISRRSQDAGLLREKAARARKFARWFLRNYKPSSDHASVYSFCAECFVRLTHLQPYNEAHKRTGCLLLNFVLLSSTGHYCVLDIDIAHRYFMISDDIAFLLGTNLPLPLRIIRENRLIKQFAAFLSQNSQKARVASSALSLFSSRPRIADEIKGNYFVCGSTSGFWHVEDSMACTCKACALAVFLTQDKELYLGHIHYDSLKDRTLLKDWRKYVPFATSDIFMPGTKALIAHRYGRGVFAARIERLLNSRGLKAIIIDQSPQQKKIEDMSLLIWPQGREILVQYEEKLGPANYRVVRENLYKIEDGFVLSSINKPASSAVSAAKRMAKLIIFDMGGTLYDDTLLKNNKEFAVSWAARQLKGERSQEEIRMVMARVGSMSRMLRHFKLSLKEYFSALSIEVDPGSVLEKDPQLKGVLLGLISQGHILAVVTNNGRVFTQNALKALGIFDLFSCVITQEDALDRGRRGKPDTWMFEEVHRRMSFDFLEAVSVGDREIDIVAARLAGIEYGILVSGRDDLVASIESKICALGAASSAAVAGLFDYVKKISPYIHQYAVATNSECARIIYPFACRLLNRLLAKILLNKFRDSFTFEAYEANYGEGLIAAGAPWPFPYHYFLVATDKSSAERYYLSICDTIFDILNKKYTGRITKNDGGFTMDPSLISYALMSEPAIFKIGNDVEADEALQAYLKSPDTIEQIYLSSHDNFSSVFLSSRHYYEFTAGSPVTYQRGYQPFTMISQKDRWSRIWEAIKLPQSEFMGRLLKQKVFKSGDKVLSLGCGRREDEIILARDIGCFVTATDISPVCINRLSVEAQRQGIPHKLTARIQDMLAPFSFADREFDAVIANCSLISFASRQVAMVINEIWRVLKDGGRVFAMVYSNADSKYGKGFPLGKNLFNIQGMPYFFFNTKMLEDAFHGFTDIEIKNAQVMSLNGEVRNMLELCARKPGQYGSSPVQHTEGLSERLTRLFDRIIQLDHIFYAEGKPYVNGFSVAREMEKSIKELPGTYYIESLGKGDFKMTVRPGAAGKTVISG